jgi:hypothetical protein
MKLLLGTLLAGLALFFYSDVGRGALRAGDTIEIGRDVRELGAGVDCRAAGTGVGIGGTDEARCLVA